MLLLDVLLDLTSFIEVVISCSSRELLKIVSFILWILVFEHKCTEKQEKITEHTLQFQLVTKYSRYIAVYWFYMFLYYILFKFAFWGNSTKTPHTKDKMQRYVVLVLKKKSCFFVSRSLSSNICLLDKQELPWKQVLVWRWPSSVDDLRWRGEAVEEFGVCCVSVETLRCRESLVASKWAAEGGENLAVPQSGCGDELVCIHNSLRLTQGASLMLGWVTLGTRGDFPELEQEWGEPKVRLVASISVFIYLKCLNLD